MKFATIIRAANHNVGFFQKCDAISITLYDGKDRVVNCDVHYAEPLFKHNLKSFREFGQLLREWELEGICPTSMNVKIDIDHVILFYKTPQAKIFPRKAPMDPLDYMD